MARSKSRRSAGAPPLGRTVADLGVGRRFAGTTQSTTVLFGVSYSTPFRW
jgi:hypothetical protein